MLPKLHKELPKETEERRTAVSQMKRVEMIADSFYNKMLRCDTRGIETEIIDMSQMHFGLSRLGHNLTYDEKQRLLKSYDKYKSSIDMLEKKCICSPIIVSTYSAYRKIE